ncbi:MAG TPA: 50S ribosomal protein L15 [Candidatus Saccharimonadia bacterium]|nr:50S ribosomal protein L15 [Candidatus Saccharimonadia bacterium]
MKIHDLQLTSSKDRKRVGRGIGSGYGKTAGRGTKGQNARTGGGVRIGFAGGQNPLAKLLPKKRGFRALNPTNYQVVNLAQLNSLKDGAVADNQTLAQAGLVKKADQLVKLLAQGELTKKLTVKVQGASTAATAAVEKAGGSVELTPLPKQPSKKATRPKVETSAS